MSLRPDHVQTTELLRFWRQFDVGTPTGHVGGNRNRADLPCPTYDVCLLGILNAIQKDCLNAGSAQGSVYHQAFLDGAGTNQNRLTGRKSLNDIGSDCLKFETPRIEEAIG